MVVLMVVLILVGGNNNPGDVIASEQIEQARREGCDGEGGKAGEKIRREHATGYTEYSEGDGHGRMRGRGDVRERIQNGKIGEIVREDDDRAGYGDALGQAAR